MSIAADLYGGTSPQTPETSLVAALTYEADLIGWQISPRSRGDGFPWVFLHPRGHVIFADFRPDTASRRLAPRQERWGAALLAAGARWYIVRVPSQLAEFRQLLYDLALVP
jgi:hypothetical protein